MSVWSHNLFISYFIKSKQTNLIDYGRNFLSELFNFIEIQKVSLYVYIKLDICSLVNDPNNFEQ